MGDTFTVKVKIVDDDSNTIHYGRTSEEMVALLNTINPDNLDKLEVTREGTVEETKAEIFAEWGKHLADLNKPLERIDLDTPGVRYLGLPDNLVPKLYDDGVWEVHKEEIGEGLSGVRTTYRNYPDDRSDIEKRIAKLLANGGTGDPETDIWLKGMAEEEAAARKKKEG